MNRSRRRSISAALIALLSAALVLPLRSQQIAVAESTPKSKAEVLFHFERPGLPIPKFTLDVNEEGAGTYTAEDVSLASPQQIHREFVLTATITKKIFALTHAAHLSPEVCVSKAKNIADTGKKTLTYTYSGTTESCTYNYSENKDVQALTEIFEGVAETMDMGRRLDFLHRFDRLGLNEAIGSLADEVSAGRALEIGTIASSLRSIASDAQVMQRVRARANVLLGPIAADPRPSIP